MSLPLLPLIHADPSPTLRQALQQDGVPFVEGGEGQGQFVVFDSARRAAPILRSGQRGIDLAALRRPPEVDPLEALADETSRRFRWRIGPFPASESIARYDKWRLRRRALNRLRAEIERRGGAWLRVGAFPFPYRSAFCFRIDYDDYHPADCQRVWQALQGHEGATSHYFCGQAYEGQGEFLGRYRGLDVGAHGYFHHTYPDRDDNLRNIARCLDVLHAAGIETRSFVAPHGRFHRQLLAALEALGITHSSEFGLAYDDLPFFPAGSTVLQVPIHPLSLGIVLEAAGAAHPGDDVVLAQAADATAEHYLAALQAKYLAGQPAFFYCHPSGRLGRFPSVLRCVLEAAQQYAALWRTTLREFATWWRLRARVALRVYREKESFLVVVDQRPREYTAALEYWRGEHVAVLPLDQDVIRFAPDALAYQRRTPRPPMTQPVRCDAPHTLRGAVKSYLDWELATPPGEIRVRSFRTLAKKALRYLRDSQRSNEQP
jgi:hypothetical protein